MLKAVTILAAAALCAPAFGASVTSVTTDYDTGSTTGSTWVYSPEELGLQPRDLSVPLPGTTAEEWAELLELEGGVPYWMTWDKVEALAWQHVLSQGWNEDNYMGCDFSPETGELTLYITEWTGESPSAYHERTGLSPWNTRDANRPTGTFYLNDFGDAHWIRTNMVANLPASVPSPSALAAGLALVVAGTLRRRR